MAPCQVVEHVHAACTQADAAAAPSTSGRQLFRESLVQLKWSSVRRVVRGGGWEGCASIQSACFPCHDDVLVRRFRAQLQ